MSPSIVRLRKNIEKYENGYESVTAAIIFKLENRAIELALDPLRRWRWRWRCRLVGQAKQEKRM